MKRYTRLVFLLAAPLFTPGLAGASTSAKTSADRQNSQNGGIDYDTARHDRRLEATQAQGPITLDGRLDEASWAAAPLATNFSTKVFVNALVQ